jgi:hypothetical protein
MHNVPVDCITGTFYKFLFLNAYVFPIQEIIDDFLLIVAKWRPKKSQLDLAGSYSMHNVPVDCITCTFYKFLFLNAYVFPIQEIIDDFLLIVATVGKLQSTVLCTPAEHIFL